MNQTLPHHDQAQFKLEQLYREARIHDLLKRSREQDAVGPSPRRTVSTVLESLGLTLPRRALWARHAGSMQDR